MAADLRLDVLSNLRIASPCPMRWEDLDPLADGDRVRHCRDCGLNVYNFASMRSEEIVDLVERTEGRLCAMLHRRADGTMLTRDCPRGLARLRRAAWRARTVAAALALLVPALVAWAATRQRGMSLADAEPFRALARAISAPPPPPTVCWTGDVAVPGRVVSLPQGWQPSVAEQTP